MKIFGLLAGSLALLTLGLKAGDVESRFRTLEKLLEQERVAGSAAPVRRTAAALGERLGNAIKRGGGAAIQPLLEELAVTADTAEIRRECGELVRQLTREREEAEQKRLQEIETLMNKTSKATVAAKGTEEMDSIEQELKRFADAAAAPPVTPAIAKALRRVELARQFTLRWQDYLSAFGANNLQGAILILLELSKQTDEFFIPRSVILARMADLAARQQQAGIAARTAIVPLRSGTPTLAEIVGRIKTLEQLGPALDLLGTISRAHDDPRQQMAASAIRWLLPVECSYREFLAGHATSIELLRHTGNTPNMFNVGDGELLAMARTIQNVEILLRRALVVLCLPRYLELPEAFQAKSGEGPADFLTRIKTQALAEGNYQLAGKLCDIQFTMQGEHRSVAGLSQASLFVAGNQQESAGQFALAVLSYERALASGADLVPAKSIGARLNALKSAHPAEFQEGLELFLRPPLARPSANPRLSPSVPLVNEPLMMQRQLPGPSLQVPAAAPPPPVAIPRTPGTGVPQK